MATRTRGETHLIDYLKYLMGVYIYDGDGNVGDNTACIWWWWWLGPPFFGTLPCHLTGNYSVLPPAAWVTD